MSESLEAFATGRQPNQVTVQAPGKLVLCGEYAVLEPGGAGLCTAVDVPVCATVTQSSSIHVALEVLAGLPGEVLWDGHNITPRRQVPAEARQGARFVIEAVQQVLEALERARVPIRPFSIQVARVPDVLGERFSEAKPGLGMSAAATVAVTAALLAWHGEPDTVSRRVGNAPVRNETESRVGSGDRTPAKSATRDEPPCPLGRSRIFSLALDAHRKAQEGRGSGIDVAASVFGGDILMEASEAEPRVTPVAWPADVPIVVVWTGRSADTRVRVARYWEVRSQDPRWFDRFVADSRAITGAVLRGIRTADPGTVLSALEQHRRLLEALGRRIGLPMDSAEMARARAVAEPFGVFKPSGAGGGDCALLFLERSSSRLEAEAALRAAGLKPLAVGLHAPGVHVRCRT